MKWRGLPGTGKAGMEFCQKPLCASRVRAPPEGSRDEDGRKRSLLVDARGGPLSLTVSGAGAPDVTLWVARLDGLLGARAGRTPSEQLWEKR